MLLVLLAAGAVQAMGEPPLRPASGFPGCNNHTVRAAGAPSADSRKLGELPPGLLQLAVDKRVDGCSVTVLPVRDRNGNHRMIPQGSSPRLTPADARSAREARPKRQR